MDFQLLPTPANGDVEEICKDGYAVRLLAMCHAITGTSSNKSHNIPGYANFIIIIKNNSIV